MEKYERYKSLLGIDDKRMAEIFGYNSVHSFKTTSAAAKRVAAFVAIVELTLEVKSQELIDYKNKVKSLLDEEDH